MTKLPLKQSALRWSWISLLIIILDQWTKFLAVKHLPFAEPQPVTPFFNLMLLHNKGAAFSFLGYHQGSWMAWLFGIFAVVISLLILRWLSQLPKNRYWLAIALTFVLGGALGNLIDRIHYGYVIDFIQLYYRNFYWPAFNIADTAITIGAIMLAIEVIFFNGKKHN